MIVIPKPPPDWRQKDHYSCGACATGCVDFGIYGVGPDNIEDWKTLLGTTLAKSTHPYSIIQVSRSLGLQVEANEGMSASDLEYVIGLGWPVITPVQDYGKRRSRGASFTYGHYLTVYGIDLAIGEVLCQDSSEDNVLIPNAESIQSPGKIVINLDDFMDVWHDADIYRKKFIHYGIAIHT